jgi:hypothetical protein
MINTLSFEYDVFLKNIYNLKHLYGDYSYIVMFDRKPYNLDIYTSISNDLINKYLIRKININNLCDLDIIVN